MTAEKNYISRKKVLALLEVSKKTLERIIKDEENNFPKGKKITERITLWDECKIKEWIEGRS